MGCLRRHRLDGYIKDYGLEYYFETGTGQAEALEHAIKYPFKRCYTVDIDEDMVEYSYNKLKDRSTCDIGYFWLVNLLIFWMNMSQTCQKNLRFILFRRSFSWSRFSQV